jgi:hypothetical protein
MNTYAKVQSLITAWKSQSLSRTDLIRAIAEACLGWPYGSAMGTVLLAHGRRKKKRTPQEGVRSRPRRQW